MLCQLRYLDIVIKLFISKFIVIFLPQGEQDLTAAAAAGSAEEGVVAGAQAARTEGQGVVGERKFAPRRRLSKRPRACYGSSPPGSEQLLLSPIEQDMSVLEVELDNTVLAESTLKAVEVAMHDEEVDPGVKKEVVEGEKAKAEKSVVIVEEVITL